MQIVRLCVCLSHAGVEMTQVRISRELKFLADRTLEGRAYVTASCLSVCL